MHSHDFKGVDEEWRGKDVLVIGGGNSACDVAVESARIANKVLLDLLNQFAAKRNATPAQIALAWVLAQKPFIVPIPGTTKLHRLTENNGAASVELSKQELQEIEEASSHIKVMGTRYTEAMEKSTGL